MTGASSQAPLLAQYARRLLDRALCMIKKHGFFAKESLIPRRRRWLGSGIQTVSELVGSAHLQHLPRLQCLCIQVIPAFQLRHVYRILMGDLPKTVA